MKWKTLIQLQSFLLMLIKRQWSQSTCTLTRGPFKGMQKGSIPKKNGNLKWHLPLGVAPPPLMAQISIHFLPHFFLLQLNLTYMKGTLHLVPVKNITFQSCDSPNNGQNTFWQSGNDSKCLFKKTFSKKRLWD